MTQNKRLGTSGPIRLTDAAYQRARLECRYCGRKVESIADERAARSERCDAGKVGGRHFLVSAR